MSCVLGRIFGCDGVHGLSPAALAVGAMIAVAAATAHSPEMGGWNAAGPVSQERKIQVSCDTSVIEGVDHRRPIGLAVDGGGNGASGRTSRTSLASARCRTRSSTTAAFALPAADRDDMLGHPFEHGELALRGVVVARDADRLDHPDAELARHDRGRHEPRHESHRRPPEKARPPPAASRAPAASRWNWSQETGNCFCGLLHV